MFRLPDGTLADPCFCYDRPKIHTRAVPELQTMGVNAPFLSHYSPDMNKPIEHVFGTLTGMMQNVLWENRRKFSAVFWQNQLRAMFFNNISTASVHADVLSLKDTAAAIIEGGGDWAPTHLS